MNRCDPVGLRSEARWLNPELGSPWEGLNKSAPDLPDHEAQEARFLSFFIFNALQALKMAIRPCIAEPLDLFRGPLGALAALGV